MAFTRTCIFQIDPRTRPTRLANPLPNSLYSIIIINCFEVSYKNTLRLLIKSYTFFIIWHDNYYDKNYPKNIFYKEEVKQTYENVKFNTKAYDCVDSL